MRVTLRSMGLVLASLLAWGCGAGSDAGGRQGAAGTLGPVDGHELPPADLERVAVGDTAPDFVLASLAGPAVALTDFQGQGSVVLVFYRGHW